jgi:hypothetical protein
MASQNDKIGFMEARYFADFKCRISRHASKGKAIKIVEDMKALSSFS